MIRFFIHRPALVALFYLLIIVTGVLSLVTMTLELWPPVEINEVWVNTYYGGASPEEVEDLITIPIEDELDGLEDVDYVVSSSSTGTSVIGVVFKSSVPSREMDNKTRDVQQRVNRVTDLPDQATTPRVDKIATENMPVVILALSGPFSELELKDIADDLRDDLDKLAGVKKAWTTGTREREVAIEVVPERLQAYGISADEVRGAVAQRHVDIPAGSLFDGQYEVLLRALGKPERLDGLERIVLRQTDAGTVYLGDVASVYDTFKDAKVLSHLNSRPCVLVMMSKEKEASTVRLVNRIDKLLESYQRQYPKARLETVFDSSTYVVQRMHDLLRNGVQGFCLVMLVLWVSIGFRRALFAAIGIPMSFLSTFVIMRATGISLNFMTLYAVFLVLGILVDDAIVVVENITRLMERGMSPRRAALEGAREVALPVIIAVTTTMVAFATMLVMTGTLGRFMSFLPMVVIIVLACSLVEALLLLPAHVAEFCPSQTAGEHLEKPTGRLLTRLQDGLERAIRWMLDHAWFACLIPPTLLFLVFLLAGKLLQVEMFPPDDPEQYNVTFRLPPGSSLDATEQMAYRVEQAVLDLQLGDLENVYAAIGYVMDGEFESGSSSNLGQVICVLKPPGQRAQPAYQTERRLRDALIGRFAGLDYLRISIPESGPPAGRALTVRVMGEDFAVLEQIAAEIQELAGQTEGVINLDTDRVPGNPELRLRIDEAKLAQTGVNFGTLALSLRAFCIGNKAAERRLGGENVDLTVRGPADLRRTRDALQQLTVPSQDGRPVPIAELVTVTEQRGPTAVYRRDDTHMVTVTADILQGPDGPVANANELNKRLRQQFEDQVPQRFPGYRVEFGGQAEEQAESFGSLRIAFAAAILIIYALLVIQFNTLSQPIAVMLAVPTGFIGVMGCMMLRGEAFTLSHMIGIVALVGIGVNDSLVYIDCINRLRREEGLSRREALVEAARTRMRPIVLTSFTTIGGLLPMALRLGGGTAYLTPLASTIIYGLTTQTIFTLLFIPVAYRIVDDTAEVIRERIWHRLVPPEDPRDAGV